MAQPAAEESGDEFFGQKTFFGFFVGYAIGHLSCSSRYLDENDLNKDEISS